MVTTLVDILGGYLYKSARFEDSWRRHPRHHLPASGARERARALAWRRLAAPFAGRSPGRPLPIGYELTSEGKAALGG